MLDVSIRMSIDPEYLIRITENAWIWCEGGDFVYCGAGISTQDVFSLGNSPLTSILLILFFKVGSHYVDQDAFKLEITCLLDLLGTGIKGMHHRIWLFFRGLGRTLA